MNVSLLFDSAVCQRLVLSLGHSLWQGAVVAAAAACAALILRRRSSQARYAAYVAALLLLAVCVPVTFALVEPISAPETGARSAAPTMQGGLTGSDVAALREHNSVGAQPAVPARIPFGAFDATAVHDPSTASSAAHAVGKNSAKSAGHAPASIAWWVRVAPWLSAAYLAGVLVMLLRIGVSLLGAQRLRKLSVPVEEADVLTALARQARLLGLKLAPPAAYCRRVAVPTVVGVLRPIVLLPVAFATSLAPAEIEALLAHELAHIRRRDPWINLLQRFIESALFFNPAVWMLSRLISSERENCCDDLVVQLGAAPERYAESLVHLAELTTGRWSSPAGALLQATGNRSKLARRVERLLGTRRTERMSAAMGKRALLLAVSAVMLAAAFALVPPASSQSSAAAQTPQTPGDIEVAPPDDNNGQTAPADPAAVKPTKDTLHGRWFGGGLLPHLLVLNADGSFRHTTHDGRQALGSWKLEDDRLVREFATPLPQDAPANGTRLTVHMPANDLLDLIAPPDNRAQPRLKYAYRRLAGDQPPPNFTPDKAAVRKLREAQQALIGTWQRASFLAVWNETFLPDGVYIYTSNLVAPSLGTWELDEGKLHIQATPGIRPGEDKLDTRRIVIEVDDSNIVYEYLDEAFGAPSAVGPNRFVHKRVSIAAGPWERVGWRDRGARTRFNIGGRPVMITDFENVGDDTHFSVSHQIDLQTERARVKVTLADGKTVFAVPQGDPVERNGSTHQQYVLQGVDARAVEMIELERAPKAIDVEAHRHAPHHEIPRSRTATRLQDEELELLKKTVELAKLLEQNYPESTSHWPASAAIYDIAAPNHVRVWKYRELGRKEGAAENEIGFGSSQVADIDGNYYLPDGTPLFSHWSERGNGMFDVRIRVGRDVGDDERVAVVQSHRLPAEDYFSTFNDAEHTIRIAFYEGKARANIIRITKPLSLKSWQLPRAFRETSDGETAEYTSVAGPLDEPAAMLVTFHVPWDEIAKSVRESSELGRGRMEAFLKPDRPIWPSGVAPKFTVQFRNRSRHTWSVPKSVQECELEIVGRTYIWAGPRRVHLSPLAPGRSFDDIPLQLDESWRDKVTGRTPKLGAGKHTVRVVLQPQREIDGKVFTIRVLSDPVEIEVVVKQGENIDADTALLMIHFLRGGTLGPDPVVFSLNHQLIPEDHLVRELTKFAQADADFRLVVKADAAVPESRVKAVIAAAQRAGVQRFELRVEQHDGDGHHAHRPDRVAEEASPAEEPLRAVGASPNGEFILSAGLRHADLHGYGSTLSYRRLVLADRRGETVWEKTAADADELIGPPIAVSNAGDIATSLLRRPNPGTAWQVHVQRIGPDGKPLVSESFGTPGWYFHGANQIPGVFSSNGKRLFVVNAGSEPELHCLTQDDTAVWKVPLPFLQNPVQPMAILVDTADSHVACIEGPHDARPHARFVVVSTNGKQLLTGTAARGEGLRFRIGKLLIEKPGEGAREIKLEVTVD